MFTTRPDDLHIAFRVAGFVRVGQTTFPSISPVTCDSDTARATSQLFEFYFLSDHAIKTVHNTVSANASQTKRLILLSLLSHCVQTRALTPHALNTAHQ